MLTALSATYWLLFSFDKGFSPLVLHEAHTSRVKVDLSAEAVAAECRSSEVLTAAVKQAQC